MVRLVVIQRLTNKSAAHQLRHNALDSEHLLLILLGQREGLVPLAFKHLEMSTAAALDRLQRDLAARPATLNGSSLYITNRVSAAFQRAQEKAHQQRHLVCGAPPVLGAEREQGKVLNPSRAHCSTVERTASTPLRWPAARGRWRSVAQRPLPSRMIAMWRGTSAPPGIV